MKKRRSWIVDAAAENVRVASRAERALAQRLINNAAFCGGFTINKRERKDQRVRARENLIITDISRLKWKVGSGAGGLGSACEPTERPVAPSYRFNQESMQAAK